MIPRCTALAIGLLSLAGCANDEQPLPPVNYVQMSERPEVRTISVIDLAARIETGDVELIDLRPPADFGAGRIAGALNAPLSHFDPASIPDDERREIVLYAADDAASKAPAILLAAELGGTVRHVAGGFAAWSASGRPVISH